MPNFATLTCQSLSDFSILMTRKMVAVVDYGSGNLRSVSQAVMHVAQQADFEASEMKICSKNGSISALLSLLFCTDAVPFVTR